MTHKKLNTRVHRQVNFKYKPIYVAIAALMASPAVANPLGGEVVSGSASINQQGNTLTINAVNGTIVNWKGGFSIAPNETTIINLPSATSQILNRDIGGNPSQILGSLLSNGRVFIINPNGIIFGANARVDVAGLVASTLKLSDADFLAGKLNFTDGANAGKVINQGAISAAKGGSIIIVAADVENRGIITAPDGQIFLAAGESVYIADPKKPEVLIKYSNTGGTAINLGTLAASNISIAASIINHAGLISANTATLGAGGKVILKAQKDITLAPGSKIEANGSNGGQVLVQSETGRVNVGGDISATGIIQPPNVTQAEINQPPIAVLPIASKGQGGQIVVVGEQIAVTQNVKLDASGTHQGGQILVGGDVHGATPELLEQTSQNLVAAQQELDDLNSAHANGVSTIINIPATNSPIEIAVASNPVPTTPLPVPQTPSDNTPIVLPTASTSRGRETANNVWIDSTASLHADTIESGNGGKVVVWADDTARSYGVVTARGGALSGNGGFIETSGKNYLDIGQAADASAENGLAGTWLLDPRNVTIVASNAPPSLDGQTPNFSPSQDSSTITNTVINTALNAGTSVNIDTGSDGTQAGDITVSAAISKTAGGNATLTLTAHNNINLNASISSNNGLLNVDLNANSDNTGGGTANLASTLALNGGSLTGGNGAVQVTTGASATFTGVTLDADVTVIGNGNVTITNGLTFANNHAINLGNGSTSGTADIIWTGTQTIGGTGQINFNANTSNSSRIYTNTGGNTLTFGSGITVNHTSGFAGLANAGSASTVVNQGTIRSSDATASHTLTIGNANMGFDNQGTVVATGGGDVVINANSWTSGGTLQVATGSTLSLGGTLGTAALNGLQNTGGLTYLTGTLNNTGNTLTLNDTKGSLNLDGGQITSGTLTVANGSSAQYLISSNNSGTLSGVTLDADINLVGGSALGITNGLTFANNHAINLGNGSTSGTADIIWTGTQTIGGTGQINFNANTSNSSRIYTNTGGNTLTFGSGITVNHTSGFAGLANAGSASTVVNQGTIRSSDATASHTLTIGNANMGFDNQGTVVATGGGDVVINANSWTSGGTLQVATGSTLSLGGTLGTAALNGLQNTGGLTYLTGTLNNTGNTLTLNDTKGSLNLDGGQITSGTLTVANGSSAQYLISSNNSGTLSGVTLDADINLVGGSALGITNGLTFANNHAINLGNGSTSGTADIIWTGTQTIGGTGQINFNANTSNSSRIYTNTGGNTLTFGSGITVNHTSGFAGLANAGSASTVVNQGTIRSSDATASHTLTIGNANMGFDNQGTVVATGGGDVVINANSWTSGGTLQVATGSTLSLGGTLGTAALNGLQNTGGLTYLTGTLNNTGNTLTLNDTKGSLNLDGGQITSGTLTVANGSSAQYLISSNNSGTLSGVTLDADINLVGGSALGITNGLTFANNHAINLGNGSTSGTADIIWTGTQTIGGTGQINFNANTSNSSRIYTNTGGNTLTFGSGITVNHTSGFAGLANAGSASTVVNQGTIRSSDATASHTLTIGNANMGFDNQGTVVATGGGDVVINANSWTSGGTLQVATGSTLSLGGTLGTAALNGLQNTGGLTYLTGTLNNTGNTLTLNDTKGSLNLDGGQITSGTLTVANGSSAQYLISSNNSGTLSGVTLDADINLVGGSALGITNGLTFANNHAINLGNGSTSGTADIIWTGTQTIGGTGQINFNANTSNSSRIYTNTGGNTLTFGSGITVNHTSGFAGLANAGSASTVVNQGTIRSSDATASHTLTIGNANMGFDNQGTVVATGGGDVVINAGNWTNTGTLQVDAASSLTTGGNWSSSGGSVIQVAATGSLVLGGTFSLSSLSALSNSGNSSLSGTIDLGGNTADIGAGGDFGANGLGTVTGTIKNGTLISGDGTTLTSASGTLDNITIGSNLTENGFLQFSNNLHLANGIIVNKGSSQWNFTPNFTIDTVTGTATINNAGGSIFTAVGGVGTFNIASGVTLQGYGQINQSSAVTINNAGTIAANTTGQTFTISGNTFNNTGILSATAGTLNLVPTNFTNDTTGNINVSGGTISITPGSATPWTNSGNINVNSGVLNLGGQLTNAVLAGHLNRTGGTVNLTGTLTNTGTLDIGGAGIFGTGGLGTLSGTIKNGTLVSGDGTTLTSASGTLDNITIGSNLTENGFLQFSNNLHLANGIIVNKGSSQWNFTPNFTIDTVTGTATINNAGGSIFTAVGGVGTFNIASGVTLQGYGQINQSSVATINNAGTIIANTAGQQWSISGNTFNNTGNLSATAGTLSITPTNFTNDTTGNVNVSGGTVTINPGSATAWTNSGNINVTSGTLNLGGQLTNAVLAGHLNRTGGTVNLTGTLTNTGTLDIGGAGIFGAGGLGTLNGGTIKNGTLISGDGTTLTSSSGTLDNITIGSNLTENGFLQFTNNLHLVNGIVLNKSNSQWNFTPDFTIDTVSGTATINNAGGSLFTAVGGSGTFNIASGVTLQGYGQLAQSSVATINNAGTIAANSGLGGWSITPTTFNNSGSLILSNGGSVSSNAATTFTNTSTGVIAGIGTITLNGGSGTLTNNGSIIVGGIAAGDLGKLTINGNLTQGTTGSIDFDVAGRSRGVTYDAMDVTGTATLAGTLNVANSGGFTASSSEALRLIRYGARSGTFTTLNVPSGGYTPVFGVSNFILGIGIGAVNEWNTNSSGNWSTAGNWTLGAPTSTQLVIIDRISGTPTVTLDTAAGTIAALDVAETLNINTNGSLTVAGASNISGTLNIAGGTLTTNAVADINQLNLSSGSWTANGVGSLNGLAFSGGTFAGSGLVKLNGTGTWSGGTFAANLDVASGNTLSINGGVKQLGAGTLTNHGNILWSAGNVEVIGAGAINNANGGLFNIQGNTLIMGDVGGGATGGSVAFTFNNQAGATLRRSSGTGTVEFGTGSGSAPNPVSFNNDGLLDVQTGVVAFNDGFNANFTTSTSNGIFNIASGATLDFGSGVHTLTSASSITGAGTLNIGHPVNSIGTVNLNGISSAFTGAVVMQTGALNINQDMSSSSFTASAGNVNIAGGSAINTSSLALSGATLSGSGSVNVSSTFNWSAGSIANTGSFNTSGTSTISDGVTLATGATWNNAGTVNMVTGNGNDFVVNGVFNNQSGAVFNNAVTSGASDIFGTGTFNILSGSTFNASSSSNATLATATVNNAGTLNITSGTLDYWNNTFNNAGTLNIAAGTSIFNTAGNGPAIFNINTGSAIAGAGTFIVNSNDTVNVNANTTFLAATNANLAGGIINVGSGFTFNLDGAFTASSGSLNGLGVIATHGASTIGDISLNSTWTNDGTITLNNIIRNSGTLNNLAAGVINIGNGDTSPLFNQTGGSAVNNAGTINKSSAITQNFSTQINNTGSINVTGGALNISSDGTDTGAYNVSTGVTLNFNGGTRNFNAGSSINGTGNVVFNSTVANFNTGADLSGIETNGNLSLSAGTLTFATGNTQIFGNGFSFTGGTIAGSDAFNMVSGKTFTWSGGSYNSTGLLSTHGTSVIGDVSLNSTWANDGTITLNNIIRNSGTLNNLAAGVINIGNGDTNPLFNQTGGSAVNNAGVINKNSAIGQTFSTIVNNTGSINLTAGNLTISSNATNTGALNVGAGTALILNGGLQNFNSGSSINGAGNVVLTGATANFNTGADLSNITANGNFSLSGGTLNFSTGSAKNFANNFSVTGGLLTGADTLNMAAGKTFTWTSGSYSGSGGLVTHGGSTIGDVNLNGTWTNDGTITLNNIIRNSGTLNNLASGVINIGNGDASPLFNQTGGSAVNNAGTINKTGAIAQNFSTGINNTGMLNVNAGALAISGAFTQSGTIETAAGTTLTRTGGFTNTGTLQGIGTFDVGAGNTLTNSGIISPGAGASGTTGTLSVIGNLVNASGGSINTELGGTTAGTQYDVVAVSGNFTAGGTLNAPLINGFTPGGGDFDIITAGGTASGSFATLNLPSGFNGAILSGLFRLTYSNITCGGLCWDGGAGTTSWGDAANWVGDVLPGTGDVVYINLVSGVNVVHATGNDSIKGLNTDINNNLTISGGSITLNDAATTSTLNGNLTLSGGTLITQNNSLLINGLFNISANSSLVGAGSSSVVTLPDGSNAFLASGLIKDLTLTIGEGVMQVAGTGNTLDNVTISTGELAVQDAAQLRLLNTITLNNASLSLNSAGNATYVSSGNATPVNITGTGNIKLAGSSAAGNQFDASALTGQGSINLGSGVTVRGATGGRVDLDGGAFAGTVRTDGAATNINLAGNISNAGNTLTVNTAAGGKVELNGAAITGGNLNITGKLGVIGNSNLLDNITISAGEVAVMDSAQLRLLNTLTLGNSALLSLNSLGNATYVSAGDINPANIVGTGNIKLAGTFAAGNQIDANALTGLGSINVGSGVTLGGITGGRVDLDGGSFAGTIRTDASTTNIDLVGNINNTGNTLSIDTVAGGTVELTGATLSGGALNINGKLGVSGNGNILDSVTIGSGEVALLDAGQLRLLNTITLGSGGILSLNSLGNASYLSGGTTTAATINGTGNIKLNGTSANGNQIDANGLTGQGSINIGSGITLGGVTGGRVDLDGGSFAGTIRTDSASTDIMLAGTVNNTGNTLTINTLAGGSIELSGATLVGGALNISGKLGVMSNGNILDNVTIATGEVAVLDASQLRLLNTVTINSGGILSLNSTGNASYVSGGTATPATVAGAGNIKFNGTLANGNQFDANALTGQGSFNIGSGITIDGTTGGNIELDGGSFAGTFNAQTGTTFTLALANNTGTIRNSGGTVSLQGLAVNAGTIDLDAGTITTNGSLQNDGIIKGDAGTLRLGAAGDQTLTNNGAINPGDTGTIGTINIAGNLLMGATGLVNLEATGKNPGQYDVLNVSGNASLAGTLNLAIIAYSPATNDNFTGITAGSFSGDFASKNLPTQFVASPSGSQYRLTFTSNCAGDICFDNSAGDFVWNNPLNWDTDLTPTAGQIVYINLAGNNTVNLNTGSFTIDSLYLTGGNSLLIGSPAALNINSLLSINTTGGLTVNGAVNANAATLTNGTISGSGVLTANDWVRTGGAFNMTGTANLTVQSGDFNTNGAYRAGSLIFNASNGSIVIDDTLETLGADGSNATVAGNAGGNGADAGTITLTASNDVVVNAQIFSHGGKGGNGFSGAVGTQGGVGGAGGDITINALGGNISISNTGSIGSKGGIGGTGGNTTSIGATGTNGVNGANGGTAAAGSSGTSGGNGASGIDGGMGGTGGTSGSITMTASSSVAIGGAVYAEGGAGGIGGAGGTGGTGGVGGTGGNGGAGANTGANRNGGAGGNGAAGGTGGKGGDSFGGTGGSAGDITITATTGTLNVDSTSSVTQQGGAGGIAGTAGIGGAGGVAGNRGTGGAAGAGGAAGTAGAFGLSGAGGLGGNSKGGTGGLAAFTPVLALSADGLIQIDGQIAVLGGHGGNGGAGGAGGVGASANGAGKVSGDGGQGGFSAAGDGADASGHIQISSTQGDIVLNADIKALTGDEADYAAAGAGGAAGAVSAGAASGAAGSNGGQFDGNNGSILFDDMRIIASAGSISQLNGAITSTALVVKSATGIDLFGPNLIANADMTVTGTGNVRINSNDFGTTIKDLDSDGNALIAADGDVQLSTYNLGLHDTVNVNGNIDSDLFGATMELFDGLSITANTLNADSHVTAFGTITLNTAFTVEPFDPSNTANFVMDGASFVSSDINSGIIIGSHAILNAHSGSNSINLYNGVTNNGTIQVEGNFGGSSLQIGDANNNFTNDGTLRLTSADGSDASFSVTGTLTNTGTVDVQSAAGGNRAISAGSIMLQAGSFGGDSNLDLFAPLEWTGGNIDSGLTISLQQGGTIAGTHTLDGTLINASGILYLENADISGAGTLQNDDSLNVELSGSSSQLGIAVTGNGTTNVNDAALSLGSFAQDSLTLSNAASLFLNDNVVVNNYSQNGGTLTGDFDLTVSNSFSQTGGIQSGNGTTYLANGIGFNANGRTLDRNFDVSGLTTLSAFNTLAINAGKTLTATGGLSASVTSGNAVIAGPGTLLIPVAAALTTSGQSGNSGSLLVSGTTINNQGTVALGFGDGGSRLYLNDGAVLNNAGTLSFSNAANNIGTNSGAGTLNNSGTISTATNGVTLATSVLNMNNSSIVNAGSGLVAFAAGSNNFSGTQTLNGDVRLAGGSQNFMDGTVINGSGNLTVNGGVTATLNDVVSNKSISLVAGSTLSVVSGNTLTANGGLNANVTAGNVTINGGGTLLTPSSATFSTTGQLGNSGSVLVSNVTLNNQGMVSLGFNDGGSRLFLNDNATLNNSGTVSFNNASNGIATNSGVGSLNNNNGGVINTASNTFSINTTNLNLNNGSSVNAGSGAAVLAAGTNNYSGTQNLIGNIQLGGGAQSFSDGTIINGSGNLSVNAGVTATMRNVVLNKSLLLNQGSTLSILANKTLTAAAGVSANVTSGSININGGGNLSIPSATTFSTIGQSGNSGNVILSNVSLNNAGTLALGFNDGGSRLLVNDNAAINNSGTTSFNNASSSIMTSSGSGTFNNSGNVIVASAAPVSISTTSFNNNAGSLGNVGGGVLTIQPSVTFNGDSHIAGDNVNLSAVSQTNNGTLNIDNGASFTLSGKTINGTGTIDNQGSLTLDSTAISGSLVNSSILNVVGGTSFISGATFDMNDGIVTIDSGAVLSRTATFAETNWRGGTLTGGGVLALNSEPFFSFIGNGDRILDGIDLSLAGFDLQGGSLDVRSGLLDISGGGDVGSLATFTISGGNVLSNNPLTNAGIINFAGGAFTGSGDVNVTSTGVINKTDNGSLTINGALNNAGQVNVLAGTLSLADGGNQTGILNVATGAELDFEDGTFNFGDGSVFTGSGEFFNTNTGATLNLVGTGAGTTVDSMTTLDMESLGLGGAGNLTNLGSISGDGVMVGDLLNQGVINFSNATIGGKFTNEAGAFATLDSSTINGDFENSGSVTVQNILTFNGSSALQIAGELVLPNSSSQFDVAGAGAVFNWQGGTIGNDTGGVGDFIISGSGASLLISGDGVRVIQGISITYNTDLMLDGTLDIQEGGTLTLNGSNNTVNNGATLSLTDGAFNNNGTLNVGGSFVYVSGTFGGSGDLANTGTLDLGSGTITNAISNSAGATINASGATFQQLFTNSGNLNLSGSNAFQGGIALNAGAALSGAGATADLGGQDLTLSGGGNFNLSGLTVTNLNPMDVATGQTFTLTNSVVNADVNIDGSLKGSGIINGTLTVGSGATLAPGFSPGSITVSNLVLNSGSILDIELGGLTAGSGFDFINVLGNATLGGTLNVLPFGGFTPAAGNTFNFMNFANSSGNFSTINLGAFGLSYAANSSFLQLFIPGQAAGGSSILPVTPTSDVLVAFNSLNSNITKNNIVSATVTLDDSEENLQQCR